VRRADSRNGTDPDVYVEHNIDVNAESASPSSAPPSYPSTGGGRSFGVGVYVNNSASYGDNNMDIDTHIEIDVNGNECEVNAAGVTIKTKINGVWYDANNLPSTTVQSECAFCPPTSAPTANALEYQNNQSEENNQNNQSNQNDRNQNSGPSYSQQSQNKTAHTAVQSAIRTFSPSSLTSTTSNASTTTTSSSPSRSTQQSIYTTSSTSAPAPTPSFISGQGVHGISWDQFRGTDQSCKTADEITTDIKQITSYGYQNIRLYGVECNAIDIALSAVDGTNTNLIIGVYDPDNYTAETADLIAQVNGRWDLITYVSVFNEAVNDNLTTVAGVQEAISYIKTQLPNGVSVTTIDTFSAFISNPALCNVGQDFIAANCQPYFSAVSASDAGNYVLQQQQNVASVCGVEYVEITGFSSLCLRLR
jgi:exo-beta-1,3-glucanase (GH17 family)